MTDSRDCRRPDPAIEWIVRRSGPGFALIWLPLLLLAPLVSALTAGRWGQAAHWLLVGGGYALAVTRRPGRRLRPPGRGPLQAEAALLLLGVLAIAYLVLWQSDRQFVFPLLAIATAVALRRRWALSVIGSLTVSGAVTAGLETRTLDAALLFGFTTFFAGAGTYLVISLVATVTELCRTRELLARAVVDEERLRFSRDLHDLLGHTLSVMVVAAQAVRRLAGRDPDAAAEHAANIETAGRRALTEVRQAVTGYRSVRLDDELTRASTALRAADVEPVVEPPVTELSAETDSLLAWVVREGTTNVLRHAGARTCRVTVHAGPSAATIEVVDDGRGGAAEFGGGLLGLRERVAHAGGELTATSTATGFRLAATVPTG